MARRVATVIAAGTNGTARAAVEAKRIAVGAEKSITARAARDQQDDEAPVPDDQPDDEAPPLRHRAPDGPALIRERASLPWVALRVGADRFEIARARAGQVVVLTAASGAGKSSLAIEMVWRHAADIGPAVYVSCELDADEVFARIVGQRCDESWPAALTDRVPHADQERALDLPRLVVVDGDDASLDGAARAIVRLRAEFPDQPILVVVDYLSILPVDTGQRDERIRVAHVAESVRRWTKQQGVVVLAVSQTSRAIAGKLRDGEIVGADTASTGAESAQIERMAAVTVAIGATARLDDGTDSVRISTGKGRMGGGDRVIPAVYDGRTGTWRVTGPAVSGAEHRAGHEATATARRVELARLAIPSLLARAPAPMSRAAIKLSLGGHNTTITAAVAALIADPTSGVVEVRAKRTGPAWPVWTRDHATAAALEIVPQAIGGADV